MAMMVEGASSFSFASGGWTYDVFLSFRGEDTRRSFTGFLYHALRQRGIDVFIDDEKLRRGEEISPALLRAIQESRISIIVFSENYAASTWCLNELVKILECMKTKGQLVCPVFYNVDPSVVRHQRASFGKALAEHEARFKNDREKLQKWRRALFEAANLSGWTLENGYEFELIQRIIDEVSMKLDRTLLHIAEHPVGLETRISEVKSLLHVGPGEDIRMLGIYGFGGIGKTTIARAIYNSIADQFDGACFLADIRESSNERQGLVQLQETLLFDTVGDKSIKLGNIYRGIPIIKRRLCHKKVLLILDDVDKLEQLQALAGGRDWFGFGSVILITTRDKHLLAAHQVEKTYEVKKLNHAEAFELFTWNAFKRNAPDAGYMHISNRVVLYAEGLPLALKVMGANLFGKAVDEWKSALDKYEKIPNREVQNVLRVTYDHLEENEKEIFLDIACFFKGETLEYVEKTLQACGFYPKFGIGVLIDRSLISIDEYNRLRMHDLIQDMGREIVRADSPLDPSKRSRLWYHEDVFEVLTENMYLDSLTSLDLSHCEFLTELPDISGVPNLTELNLDYCTNLAEVHDSVGFLEKLVELRAYGCTNLKVFPCAIRLLSLKSLILIWCSSLQRFPDILGKMENLTSVSIESSGIEELPPSIGGLVGLQELSMTSCLSLKELPDSIDMLKNLRNLDIEGCPQLRHFLAKLKALGQHAYTFDNIDSLNLENCGLLDEDLPIIFSCFPKLALLVLSKNNIVALPICIQECLELKLLHLADCKQLQDIPGIPPQIQFINARNCTSLTAESSSLLLRQENLEAYELQVMLPGTRIPEWFDHCSKGKNITFWVGKNFPMVILCFVLAVEGQMKEDLNCEVQFFINDEEVYELEIPTFFPELGTDHVWLYDLRTQSSIQWHALDLYLVNDWNQVEISCEKLLEAPNVTLSWCGVHVCRQEVYMQDIRFTDPDLDLDSSSDSDEIDTDIEKASKRRAKLLEDFRYSKRIEDNCHNFNNMQLEVYESLDGQITERGDTASKHKGKNITASHVEMDQSQEEDKPLLYTKALNNIAQDLMASVCIKLGGTSRDTDSGSSRVALDHTAKVQPKFQVTSPKETPNIQAPSTTVSGDQDAKGELTQNISSIMAAPTTIDFSKDDAEMEAFYASLNGETSVQSLSKDTCVISELSNTLPSEETQKALNTLEDFLSKDFSVLLDPGEYGTMKDTLRYLSNLSTNDKISVDKMSLIIEVSREFTLWSCDYSNASRKIKFATANLLKADELEEGLEANKNYFKEVLCLENDLHSQLAYLEERKKELEEQINTIKANISASESAKNVATRIKREVFEEAKTLKAQRDELRRQVPHLKVERELAEKIQAHIRTEWSKLGEKFKKSSNDVL